MVKRVIMLKKSFVLAAVALIAFSACQNKVDSDLERPSDETVTYPVEMTFYGTNDFNTKTVLNDEYILWQSGDAVKVLWSETGWNKAGVTPYDQNLKAEFTTTVEDAPVYYGVFPFSASSSYVNGRIEVTVPASQSGVFGDANIAVAKADSENMMNFKHIVGFLEFTIDKAGVLEISGSSSNSLAGKVIVTGFDDNGKPEYEVTGEGPSITVNVKSSGTYYVALLPDAVLDYLSITLNDGKSTQYALSANSIRMAAGKLVSLGNITKRFDDKRPLVATLESFIIHDFVFD